MKCYRCRAEIPEGETFCYQCGAEQGFPEELIKRAIGGEQEAITELYNRTYNNAYFTVKALIKDEDTALDIIQDSYVKAFKNLEQLQEADKFRAWIKRICHNQAVDYLRKTKPVLFSTMSTDDESTVEFEDDRTENLPEEAADLKETSRLIKEILDSLSDEQRLVVGMFYYEQLSVKEIANTLSVSENTVKSRLNYARKKIEERVLHLEKTQGIRLHSLAPIPFLLWLFKSQDVQAAQIPSLELLSVLQKECAAYSSNPAAGVQGKTPQSSHGGAGKSARPSSIARNAGKAGAKAGKTAAVKTAAGAAGKGIATKIIAGIAAVAVVGGGGTAGIIALNKNHQAKEEQQIVREVQGENAQAAAQTAKEAAPQATPTPAAAQQVTPQAVAQETPQAVQEIVQEVSSTDAYQSVLDEYGRAMGKGYYDESIVYPNANALMLQYYYRDGGYDGAYFTGFYYTYYDIDGNGTDELLIGYGAEEKNVVDVYAIKDDQPYKVIDTNAHPLGDRSRLYIYPDGTMTAISSGGFESLYIDTFRLEGNGESVTSETNVYEGEYDLDAILAEKFNNQQWIVDFDWQQIDIKWDETKTGNAKTYIGQYMNGQDWNAGTLTIEENDEDSVKVRLEAFRNQSDQELSTIFEGIGYETGDGLVIDLAGRQVNITGRSELTLDPAASLREEWNLDPYVYDASYLYIGAAGVAVDETASVDLASYDGYAYYENDHIKYRLDTADGNLSLTMWAMSGEPVYYERYFYADLSSADISGNTYTVYDWTCGDGVPTSYIQSIRFTFNDTVTMEVQSDEMLMAGGAGDNILTGTYTFTGDSNTSAGNSGASASEQGFAGHYTSTDTSFGITIETVDETTAGVYLDGIKNDGFSSFSMYKTAVIDGNTLVMDMETSDGDMIYLTLENGILTVDASQHYEARSDTQISGTYTRDGGN